MPDFSSLANAIVSLHDTEADPTLVDSAVEHAVTMSDTPSLRVAEDLFGMLAMLSAHMDQSLLAQYQAAELAFMATA